MQALTSRHPGLSIIVICITSFILGALSLVNNSVLDIFIFIALPLMAVVAIVFRKGLAYFANDEVREWTAIRRLLTLTGSLFVMIVIWVSLFIGIILNSTQDRFYSDIAGILLWIGENVGKGLLVFLEFGILTLIIGILSESSKQLPRDPHHR
jgi:hypothetical protein